MFLEIEESCNKALREYNLDITAKCQQKDDKIIAEEYVSPIQINQLQKPTSK